MKAWKHFYDNLELMKKLFLMIAIFSLLITIIFGCGLSSMSRVYNDTLYEYAARGIGYVIDEIDRKLEDIRQMSNDVIADSEIQEALINLAESDDSNVRARSMSNIYSRFFKHIDSKYINSVAILTPDGKKIQTRETAVPDDENLLRLSEKASENKGRVSWDKRAGLEDIIICSRDIRQIKYTKMNHLGTLFITVRFGQMIESILAEEQDHVDSEELIVMDQDGIIYASGEILPDDTMIQKLRAEENNYIIEKINGKQIFIIGGKLNSVGWEYLYLLDYDSVFKNIQVQRAATVFATLLAALVVMALIAKGMHGILKHIQILLSKINRFGNGLPVAAVSESCYEKRKDEIGKLHSAFDEMTRNVTKLTQENYDKQILIRDARIKMLQQQINPHFLYNTLATINGMAKEYEADDIETVSTALADLFRASISGDSEMIILRDEITFLHNYIDIQKIRFRGRFRFYEEIEEELMDISVPRLCIQPLVENAIKYAVEMIDDVILIKLNIKEVGDSIEIRVSNTNSYFEPDMMERLKNQEVETEGTGVGLLNIERRIQLIYGDDYGIVVKNDGNEAVVILRIRKNGGEA